VADRLRDFPQRVHEDIVSAGAKQFRKPTRRIRNATDKKAIDAMPYENQFREVSSAGFPLGKIPMNLLRSQRAKNGGNQTSHPSISSPSPTGIPLRAFTEQNDFQSG